MPLSAPLRVMLPPVVSTVAVLPEAALRRTLREALQSAVELSVPSPRVRVPEAPVMSPPSVRVPLPASVMPELESFYRLMPPRTAVPPLMLRLPARAPWPLAPPSLTLVLVRVTPVLTLTAEACVLLPMVPPPI